MKAILKMSEIQNTEQKDQKSRMNWKTLLIPITGIILGAIGGYIYYIKIGCEGGTCPITSNPALTMLWGAILGFLIFDMFRKKPSKEHKSKQESEPDSKT